MKSTYSEHDVTFLLKDLSGRIEALDTTEREKKIQSGIHYSEMIPLEQKPSSNYLHAYESALNRFSASTANAVQITGDRIYNRIVMELHSMEIVLISLARAGTPIGILLKHYLEKKYQIPVFHYSISIIRGKGIDCNAVHAILKNHPPNILQFVDGWIGKGTIQNELASSLSAFSHIHKKLAVLSDPANITDLCGTHEDILIPNSCLNATVSGLISRTILSPGLIQESDFHGAVFYKHLLKDDRSQHFISSIEKHFDYNSKPAAFYSPPCSGIEEVNAIAEKYHISDLNYIKPGIGEATRVLLRRFPDKLLLVPGYEKEPMLKHLLQLAQEKDVKIEKYPFKNYKACSIIRKIADI